MFKWRWVGLTWLVGLLWSAMLWGQTELDWITQVKNKPAVDSREYKWTRTNGLGASGDLSASGAGKIVTLVPGPKSITTTTPVYISGGTGTAEVVTPSATTCTAVRTASCTITVTTANTHTGAWSVRSATAGVQEAIAAVGGNAATILIGEGTHLFYTGVSVTDNRIAISGVGQETIISPQFADGDVFFFDGDGLAGSTGHYNSLRDLQIFNDTVTPGTLTALHIDGQVEFFASRLTTYNVFKGIYIEGQTTTSIVWIKDSTIKGIVSGGIGIHQVGGADVYILNNAILAYNYLDQPSAGIRIDFSTGTKIVGNEVFAMGFALYLGPGDGQLCHAIDSFQNWYDSGDEDGFALVPTGTGKVQEVISNGDWFSGNQRNGIEFGSAGTIEGVTIANARIRENHEHGIAYNGGSAITFSNNLVYANSRASSGTYHGFSAGAGAGGFHIQGGIYAQASGYPTTVNTQGYGILVVAGASDNYSITGAIVTPNVTGGIGDGGTGVNKTIESIRGATDTVVTIASASTLDLTSGHFQVYKITGTTQITTIQKGHAGRRICLIFTDASPGGVGTGGNIARAQTAVQNQSIWLTFDGTNWY